jgi:DNA processing protein
MDTSQPENGAEWLALHLIPGLGNIACKNLLMKFGRPKSIFRASLSDLLQVEGVRREVAERIVKREYMSNPAKVQKSIERQGARIISCAHPEYPAALREIHDPPALLYVKGKGIPPNLTFIAVVGSRNPTSYGMKASEMIGQGLARRGVGVVSGMARGIDSAAHWGCLEGRGFTLAVLGTGIDVLYPGSNAKLHDKIVEKGAVISEFPPGTPPEPKNFPIRNRIISGLSKAVVVVEATLKSGSLITASLALEQGREVLAVPGSVNSFKSTGCHFLIKQGARLVENADDILDELGLNYNHIPKNDSFKEAPPPPLEEDEKKVYDIIGDYPLHIDEIAREAKLEPGEASSILMKMELRGIVRQLPGKMFVR